MVTRKQLIEKAREYLETPWRHQGRKKGIGVDCVGLFACVLRDLGVPVKDRTDYSREPKPRELLGAILDHCNEIPVMLAAEADLLTFWVRHPTKPQHIGLLTDVGLIHTPVNCKVIEYEMDERLIKRIHSAYSFKGVAQWHQ